jgi:hypothetical protein
MTYIVRLPVGANLMGLASALHLSPWGIFPPPEEKPVRLARTKQRITSMVLAFCLAIGALALISSSPAWAQEQAKWDELLRKAKVRVAPVYPDVALGA